MSLILLGISQVRSDWDKVPFVLTVDKPFLLSHRNQLFLLLSRPTHFCRKSPVHYILSASLRSLAPWSQFSRGLGPGKRWVVLLILPLVNVPLWEEWESPRDMRDGLLALRLPALAELWTYAKASSVFFPRCAPSSLCRNQTHKDSSIN